MLYTPLQVGLPPAKNTKFVVTTWVISSSECIETRFRPGLRPADPAGGAYDSPRPSSRLGRGHPLPIPLPPRRLRCLDLAAIPLSSKKKSTPVSTSNTIKPDTHWRQSRIRHGRLCRKSTLSL